MSLIEIRNMGTKIVSTNYWDTDWAKRGLIAVSINAGEIRLLIPDRMQEAVSEADKCEYFVISKGSSKVYMRVMYEILFEDHSDNPYSLLLDERQFVDLKIPDRYADGRKIPFSLWTKNGKQSAKDAYYRIVRELPCLEEYRVL